MNINIKGVSALLLKQNDGIKNNLFPEFSMVLDYKEATKREDGLLSFWDSQSNGFYKGEETVGRWKFCL